MSFDTRLSPARVTVAAASEFPRWALFALLVAYIGAGLFGRDPWYAEDGLGLGIIQSMAHGEATAWWLSIGTGRPGKAFHMSPNGAAVAGVAAVLPAGEGLVLAFKGVSSHRGLPGLHRPARLAACEQLHVVGA